jgi:LPXTG-site transpeptidase (sortase) family protein
VKLTRINTLLLVAIILVNSYIVVMPFVPAVSFWIQQHGTTERQLSTALQAPSISTSQRAVGDGDRLVVPAMLLYTPINEGTSQQTLSKGVWHLPFSSTPPHGGNTVIVGHRFTYTNPEGAFYNLNKVTIGDEIGVFWQRQRYLYRVTEVETVPPTAVRVQAPSTTPELTLYTCTPLWLPKDRLVVVATLEGHT